MLETKYLRALSSNLISDPDEYMTSFRENVRMYIDQKEITLAEISELADIPESTLKSFVYGASADCHLSTAIKLAKVFSVSVDELVGCGTISPQTCESLQLTRQLPESFTHFVRWAIHYHYEMLRTNRVSEKSVEIMDPEIGDNGNLKMTNNFSVQDISNISDDIRPKIFMGIRIPTDILEPIYMENDILYIANDRKPRFSEPTVVCVRDNMWFLKCKEEIENGVKVVNFYSLRDGAKRASKTDDMMILGYVALKVPAMYSELGQI